MRPTILAAAAVLALGLPALSFAAGGGADSPRPAATPATPADPNFAQAKAMIEAKNYAGAIPLLQQVVQRDPRNADAYNLLGFATRESGNPQRLAAVLPAGAGHRSRAISGRTSISARPT